MKKIILLVALAFGSLVGGSSHAAITLDYFHDTSSDGFFTSNATAKAALDAAVADINVLLDLNLGAITAANDVVTGSSGSTTASINYNFSYTNPTDGTSVALDSIQLASNEIRLYVGMRELNNTTIGMGGNSVLGQGGPGGFGVSFGASSGSGFMGWDMALDAAEAAGNTIYERGDGPIIGSASGSFPLGGDPGNYELNVGATHGHLWFDIDTNNDGLTDSVSELENSWHFDHTTDVAAGKNDFYSVAVHEVLHAIGFGTSDSWDDLVSGTNWTGTNVIAEFGTGTNVIDASGGHIASGLMSTRLFDGAAQEAAMDPTLTVGTRKYLTALDAAFLRDIGYSTTAVPEPSSLALLTVVGIGIGVRRRRSMNKISLRT